MNYKKILVVIVMVLTLSLTGCTRYVSDEGKNVREETTGQNLVANILCKPEDKNVLNTYKKYEMEGNYDISELPSCSKFTPASGGYEGIWSSLFIKPLSWLIIKLGTFFNNYGIAIIVVTLIIRFIIFPLSKKSAMQSEGMKKASKDIQRLQNKYKNKTSQQDQMMQAQEMMAIYKKYDINPMAGCLFAFIQMPLFFAFLESLYRIPAVFEGKFLFFNLGMTPFNAIFGSSFSISNFISSFGNGNIVYILLPVIVGLSTFFSFKMNSGMNVGSPEQEKQMKLMMNIMMIFITFMSFIMSTSIIIYWITGSLFTIIQTMLIRRSKDVRVSKVRSKK